jgi:hypothetical protein
MHGHMIPRVERPMTPDDLAQIVTGNHFVLIMPR